ncbi:MAG: PHP domain-containing protein [Planctomycetia bacterium]|nr:PHP domain-containing protein [Planctomycetia bacterium]
MAVVRFLTAIVLAGTLSQSVWADAVERMGMEKLRATHERVESLKKELRKVTLPSGYDDVRALLHVHSAFSHDSRGTIDEIIAAAKKVGVRVIMFTEHPASHYDYVIDGHQGLKDGVLLIPGAETEGFLAYPKTSIQQQKSSGAQQFADLVRGTGGMTFLCHLEERMDWEIAGLTGSEIYNTHADFKDEPRFLAALRSPLTLFSLLPAVTQYPQEMFATLQDYPADYLKRWDQLCQKARHTGVSANDAHHNQAFRARLTDENKVQLEDGLGKKLAQLDPDKLLPLKAIVAGKKPGDLVLDLDLDPYERSFHHVSTHLLMRELTTEDVWEALQAGRAYVAFDWMADPTGFVLRADRSGDTWSMGSEVPGAAKLRLRAEAPLEGAFKLIRNGEVISEQSGNAIDAPLDKPGNYRVEVWLTLAGEARPWILSNPIYVRPE